MYIDLEKWLDFIEQDQNLSKELLISKMEYEKQKKSLENFICDKFIPEAEKYGFHFSFDDVLSFSKANRLQELSVEDLKVVSGGSAKTFVAAGAIVVSLLTIIPVASIFKFNANSEELSPFASSFSDSKKSVANNSGSIESQSSRSNFRKVVQDYINLKNSSNKSTSEGKQSTDVSVKNKTDKNIKVDQMEKLQDMGTDEVKKQIDALKVQLNKEKALREKAEKTKTFADEQISKEKERADILEARVKELEAQVATKDNEIAKQKSQIEELTARSQEMNQRLNNWKNQFDQLT